MAAVLWLESGFLGTEEDHHACSSTQCKGLFASAQIVIPSTLAEQLADNITDVVGYIE